MGNRLTQIATRTGDDGTTGLGDNRRVSKNSLRVHAMGDVDELNSNLGVLLCEPMPDDVRALLVEIQHQLFNLGGELSIPGFELLKPEAVLALDEALDYSEEQAAELIALDDALTALAALDRRKCRVIELRYFGGLSVEETATVLGVSVPTVVRDQRMAQAWLHRELS